MSDEPGPGALMDTIDTGFGDVLAGEVYKPPEEAPRVVVETYPGSTPHVCANATGGNRCDVCFGPVTATVTEDPQATKDATKALIALPANLDYPALSKLARAVAMDIKERHVILQEFALTQTQYEYLEAYNEFYKGALAAACKEWHAPLSTQERIKMEAAAILEDTLPGLGARMQNKAEGLPGVIEAAKLFAKVAGVGERETGNAAPGERFSINIDLGGDQKIVVSSTPVAEISAPADGVG